MNSFHINFIDKKYSNLLLRFAYHNTISLFLFFMILTSVVIPVASSTTTAIGASIRIATIIAVILRLHHVLRIVVHLGRPMASGMAPIVGLLRLRIVVVVWVRRAHIVALHIVTLTSTLALASRVFFAPRALDGGSSNISAVDGHDGGASGLLVVVPDKGVAFVAEVPDFEDSSVR